jgi:ribulose kinase
VLTIGIDYGANAARALVVRCADGAEFGDAVVGYPFGDEGAPLDESDRRLARRRTSLAPMHCDPIAARQTVYDKLYALCRQPHDGFGGFDKSIDLSRFMKALIEIKYAQRE